MLGCAPQGTVTDWLAPQFHGTISTELWGRRRPERVVQILEDALQLPPLDRATVIETLLASLAHPGARIDELWAQEAEDRIVAFDAGHLQAYDAEKVFTALDLP